MDGNNRRVLALRDGRIAEHWSHGRADLDATAGSRAVTAAPVVANNNSDMTRNGKGHMKRTVTL